MLLHIVVFSKEAKVLMFQRACALFGCFEMLQDLGIALYMWDQHCRLQYILFFTGSLYKAFLAVAGVAAIYLVSVLHVIPTDAEFMRYTSAWLSIATIVLIILFSSDANYEIGCINKEKGKLLNFENVSMKSKLFFILTYCLFTGICGVTVSYFSAKILYRFRTYKQFLTLRTTVGLYAAIFIFAVMPGALYLAHLSIQQQKHSDAFLESAGLSMCSAGWLFSFTYFLSANTAVKAKVELLTRNTHNRHLQSSSLFASLISNDAQQSVQHSVSCDRESLTLDLSRGGEYPSFLSALTQMHYEGGSIGGLPLPHDTAEEQAERGGEREGDGMM
jgi:hypothetical protein